MLFSELDTMVRAYLACAAWADAPEGCGVDTFDAESIERAQVECKAFLYRARYYLGDWTPEQAGHDFWLSRNGHGSGFFDRTSPMADVLQSTAKTFGELHVYLPETDGATAALLAFE